MHEKQQQHEEQCGSKAKAQLHPWQPRCQKEDRQWTKEEEDLKKPGSILQLSPFNYLPLSVQHAWYSSPSHSLLSSWSLAAGQRTGSSWLWVRSPPFAYRIPPALTLYTHAKTPHSIISQQLGKFLTALVSPCVGFFMTHSLHLGPGALCTKGKYEYINMDISTENLKGTTALSILPKLV